MENLIVKPCKFLLLVVGSLVVFLPVADAQVSLDAVLKDCEKKTIVMGRDEQGKIVKVGEQIRRRLRSCSSVLTGKT